MKLGGKGRGRASEGTCCCDRKVVIWEFGFFLLPNKTVWALVYCPEALGLHSTASCTHCTNELDLYTREIPYDPPPTSSPSLKKHCKNRKTLP